MPVIGLNLKYIDSSREEEIEGNLQVNNSPKIKGVELKSVGSLGEDALSLEFEYLCEYQTEEDEESVAEINIGGEVLFMAKNPQDIQENWEENEELPDEIVIPVINSIMRKALTRAVKISEDLQLPPPIRFPRAKKQTESARYIG